LDLGDADRFEDFAFRHLALDLVKRGVLDEKNRVVGSNGRLEQAFCVVRSSRRDDLQSGKMSEDRIRGLRVGGAELAASASDGPDDDRHVELAAEHAAQLGSVIHDLVHCQEGEVDRHQLGHRLQSGHRCSVGGADDHPFGDRRIEDALGPEMVVEALGDGVGAAPDADFFAEDDDALVAFHLLPQRLRDRLAHCQRRHRSGLPRA
jgi:hypothetical protein